MIVLTTKRLILRTWQNSDLEPMTAINQDSNVMEYFPGLQNTDQTLQFINRIKQHQDDHGFSLYAIEIKNTGEFIGFAGLLIPSFEAHFTPAVEIGWRLASSHWNKGFATEAAKAVLNFAFTKLNLEKVVSFTVENNLRSRRVMEKIGMHYDPEDDFAHPKLDKTSPLCRHVLYRLTKDEYLSW